jgi:mRNA-degrading endonuclease RelE of RelBE toxin-antitoxin system
MFTVVLLPDAESSFKRLDTSLQKRIVQKIDWFAENADTIIHHPLKSLPDDLRGLCRIRAGDYRIIYWIYYETKQIKIYEIEHRSKDYHSLKR